MDELTSDSPGTRFGPRAIRAASCARRRRTWRPASTRCATALRVVDFGDAPILPADPVALARGDPGDGRAGARRGRDPGHPRRRPLDRRARHPRRAPTVHGPVGLIHFDTHTDTGREVFGATLSHGSCMYRLVESGHVDPERYVQIGLRGYWPGAEEFGWQRERGIVSHFMHDVRDRGIRAVVADAIAHVGAGPVFLSVDIDVLDPAFAPGHRHARAGRDDLGRPAAGPAARSRADVELVGAEVVEVLPDRIGSRDITALVAERVVRETLTGVALAQVRQLALSGNAP